MYFSDGCDPVRGMYESGARLSLLTEQDAAKKLSSPSLATVHVYAQKSCP